MQERWHQAKLQYGSWEAYDVHLVWITELCFSLLSNNWLLIHLSTPDTSLTRHLTTQYSWCIGSVLTADIVYIAAISAISNPLSSSTMQVPALYCQVAADNDGFASSALNPTVFWWFRSRATDYYTWHIAYKYKIDFFHTTREQASRVTVNTSARAFRVDDQK